MSLNENFVGRQYPPSQPYVVGREKIREFARAIHNEDPIHTDVAAARARGFADLVAPATYAVRLSMKASEAVVSDPELGLDYSRVVHGDQSFEYTLPIVAGDELTCQVTIDQVRSVAGNDMLTLRADISKTSGDHVVTAYSVLVARGA